MHSPAGLWTIRIRVSQALVFSRELNIFVDRRMSETLSFGTLFQPSPEFFDILFCLIVFQFSSSTFYIILLFKASSFYGTILCPFLLFRGTVSSLNDFNDALQDLLLHAHLYYVGAVIVLVYVNNLSIENNCRSLRCLLVVCKNI